MKKFTLTFIILFFTIVLVVGILALLFPPTGSNSKSAGGTVTNTGATATAKTFTLDTISQHSTVGDCYLVVKGAVYDVSSYVSMHPGGKNSITTRCGKEVTSIFLSIHSNFAWDLLGKYYIGEVSSSADQGAGDAVVQATQDAFKTIETALLQQYSGAEIIQIKPTKKEYIAKLVYVGVLYEVHTDQMGTVLSEEIENDEHDWSVWDTDDDDL